MTKQKLPKAVAGGFIFNDKGELFLMKSPKWNNNYICPGGTIELGEKIQDALIREVKEETNMDIKDIELVEVVDGIGLEKDYRKPENHLIFFDHIATVRDVNIVQLDDDEGIEYMWKKPVDWLKEKNIEKFTRSFINKNLIENNENFEHKYKRALADYQNLLKQTAQDKQDFAKYANEQIILEILPVYDNLKIALKHSPSSAKASAGKDEKNLNAWEEGVKYVLKQFNDILKNIGVEEIESEGKKFDPEKMEALEGKGNKVKKEIKTGYIYNGKVIMPAKVILK